MKIESIKTRIVRPGECSLESLIIESVPSLAERSIVAISSKIVALCQNRVVDKSTITKAELVRQESDYYLPDSFNNYGFSFTITNKTLIASAGIDESNADGLYVLWPENPQKVAEDLRAFMRKHYEVDDLGVIITDSNSMPPMRYGTIGIMLAHSGFAAVRRLAGTKDLFGKKFKISTSGIGGGLAAAANVVMGEGAEQTPIAVISDVPFVEFQYDDPTPQELDSIYISPELDLYAPFILSAPWREGGRSSADN